MNKTKIKCAFGGCGKEIVVFVKRAYCSDAHRVAAFRTRHPRKSGKSNATTKR